MSISEDSFDYDREVDKTINQEFDTTGDETEDGKLEALRNEVTQLSDSVFIYQNRKLSDHGNVFEGEIRSGVYGVRVCVIKFARKSERNVREAGILTKLGSHTHVISIIQSGIYKDMFDDRVYIALDKCHEHNLHQHITHQNESGLEFNLNEALEYSKQIIAGVTYVHENLIIHKDLKPSNILLSHDKSTIKLADFGLSQEIKSTASKVHSKHQFGTNGFRPIESFGNNWVSLKSDIFSLGVVLYFVLSNGKSPFGDETSLWIYNTKNELIDLSHLLVSNEGTFQHLIKLMLDAERCRRPSIWQVADHPCWTGGKVKPNFDYSFEDEIDDSDIRITEQGNQDSSDSESEMENRRQLLRALRKMGLDVFRSAMPETSIILFDWSSKHLTRFNLRDKCVTRMHELNEDMKSFSSILMADYIYVLTERSMYRIKHNDVTSRWERMADIINDHGKSPPAVAVSGEIFVAGGLFSKSVSKYDPLLNRWEKLKEKQLATNSTAIVASKEYFYCIGGYVGYDQGLYTIDRVERMNILSQTWDVVMPMWQARGDACAVEYNGNIIVAGGSTSLFSRRTLHSVEKYDPEINQWTIMKPMMTSRADFRCHFIEENFYAVGGWWMDKNNRSVKPRTTIEKYNAEKDEWVFFHDLGPEINILDSVWMQIRK